MEDCDEYGINRSFRSDEQVLVLDPCDYSHLSDGSAQDATPIFDDDSRAYKAPASPKMRRPRIDSNADQTSEEKHVAKKGKLFSKMFIGRKIGNSGHNKAS